jgi:hypothetical protein
LGSARLVEIDLADSRPKAGDVPGSTRKLSAYAYRGDDLKADPATGG